MVFCALTTTEYKDAIRMKSNFFMIYSISIVLLVIIHSQRERQVFSQPLITSQKYEKQYYHQKVSHFIGHFDDKTSLIDDFSAAFLTEIAFQFIN
jgi:hypothetical protein